MESSYLWSLNLKSFMKKIILLLLTGTVVLGSSCSDVSIQEKIRFMGSAETVVTPDIVYVGISLREYFISGTKQRVTIETLELKLKASHLDAGIDLKNLLINNAAS